jgi:tetratricopeptide (TPR) repeat protein
MAQGEFGLVTEYLKKAIQKGRRSTLVADSDLYAMLADAAVQQRDEAALREYAPLLEESAMLLEHNIYLATAHRAWGVLHRLEDQYELAEARLVQAIDLFRGLDTRWQLGRTLFEMGQLAANRSKTAEAKEHTTRALTLFGEMGLSPTPAGCTAASPRLFWTRPSAGPS